MTRKKIMNAFFAAAIIVLALLNWHCFTAAGHGIGAVSKRTAWSTPSQKEFATPAPGSRVTIRHQDSRMMIGRSREFPQDSVSAINLAKVDSLGWHNDFRKAGMVIGLAADLAILVALIVYMDPIISGSVLGGDTTSN